MSISKASRAFGLSLVCVSLAGSPRLLLAQISDVSAPQVSSFTFSPSTVDVTTAGKSILFDIGITDDLSGVTFACDPCSYRAIGLRAPSGRINAIAPNWFTLSSGTALNGVWRGSFGISRYSESGVWQVSYITLKDNTGNTVTLSTADLESRGFATQINVISNPDTTPPQLTSFTISPAAVDVSSASQTATFRLGLSDSPAGVTYFPTAYLGGINITLRSPSGAQRQQESNFNFVLESGTAQNGVWKVPVTLPRYSEAGVWTVVSVSASDNALNYAAWNTAALQALGFPTTLAATSVSPDTTPPQLASLSFSPISINTEAAAQDVTVTLRTTDNRSGVDFFGNLMTPFYNETKIQFVSPSGQQVQTLDPFGDPSGSQPQTFGPRYLPFQNPFLQVGGSFVDGTWQAQLRFPRYSEGGTWRLATVVIQDSAGNRRTLNTAQLEALGIATRLDITRPSGAIDGVAGSGGGSVSDAIFGPAAQITVPPGVLGGNTNISIDVLQNPPSVPIPQGYSAPGTRFVNLELNPRPSGLVPAPGLTIVLPLINFMPAGTVLRLQRIDPLTGSLTGAVSVSGGPVQGFVQADGLTVRFTGVASLSTVVGLIPSGAVPGDLNSDGRIDCADVATVRAAFGKSRGQTGYDPKADVNNDGIVNVYDLAFVIRLLPSGTICR